MKLLYLFLAMVLPMVLTQVGYRLLDRDCSRTRALADRFPFIEQHRFWSQILFPLAFIALFGVVSVAAGLNAYVFFIVTGLAVGLINGIAISLMKLGDVAAEEIEDAGAD